MNNFFVEKYMTVLKIIFRQDPEGRIADPGKSEQERMDKKEPIALQASESTLRISGLCSVR